MKYFGYLALILSSSVTLTSCFAKPKKFEYDIPEIAAAQPDEGDGYRKVTDYTYSLNDVHKTLGMYNLQSTGDAKILVVPVMATDAPVWTTKMLNNVKNGFFGEPDDTGWHSVKSFYYYSSFGKLNISGEVAPVLKSQYSTSQLTRLGTNGDDVNPDTIIVQEFENSSLYSSLRKQYDIDNNGFIDSVIFVYSNEINADNGYWAWVYWNDSDPSSSLPTVNSYMWVSYDFIVQNKKSEYVYAAYGDQIDGHTIIHETGHLLGLDDYYCYDQGGWDPSGKIEMHSFNIGDESVYSKMSLGWTNPYYVKTNSSVTLTLRTSAGYGDAIIVNDNWNGSIQDEYIAIEYYTPNGMNLKDSQSAYPGNGYQMYTIPGFRIYHIDARVVELGVRGKMVDYVTSLTPGKTYTVGASNSKSYSYLNEHKDDYKLLHLLEANGTNTFKTGKAASNNTLFTSGKTLEASSQFFYNSTKFNGGNTVGYRFSIGNCDQFQGTITISKL